MTVCVFMCMHVYVYMIVSCMFILHLYVHYDYVQHCEDTVSVKLHYINYIYYYYYQISTVDSLTVVD